MSLIKERLLQASSFVTPALTHKQKNVAKCDIVLTLHKGHNINFIIDCQACHSKTNNPK